MNQQKDLLVDSSDKGGTNAHADDHTSVKILMQHHGLDKRNKEEQKSVQVATPDHL